MKPRRWDKQPFDNEIFDIDCSERLPSGVTISSVAAKVFTEDGDDISATWTLSNKTDISFGADTQVIVSVAGDFSVSDLFVGRKFVVSGSTYNDGTYTVVTCTPIAILVAETLMGEAAGATVTITATGMIHGTPSVTGSSVYVQVKEGVDGDKYNVQVRLTLSNGEYAEDDIVLYVNERPGW